MAGSTTNYGATKPAVGEAYDVNVTNNNNDIWDTQIKNRENQAKGINAGHFSAVATDSNGISTLSIIKNIASFAFKAGRTYLIEWDGGFDISAASNYFFLGISSCSTADASGLTTGLTLLDGATITANNVDTIEHFYIRAIYQPVSDTTLQIKFHATRVVGGGNIDFKGTQERQKYSIMDKGKP